MLNRSAEGARDEFGFGAEYHAATLRVHARPSRYRTAIPRQRIVKPAGGIIGDADGDTGHPGLRVDVVERRDPAWRVEDGGALTVMVEVAKQPCLAAQWCTAERTPATLLVK